MKIDTFIKKLLLLTKSYADSNADRFPENLTDIHEGLIQHAAQVVENVCDHMKYNDDKIEAKRKCLLAYEVALGLKK